MAYCTAADVRLYLNIESLDDDELLTALIARAQQRIETHTHRVFSSTADSTRNFTVGVDTHNRTLWFDEDICSITTITTDADGSSPATVSSTEYVTEPRNRTPYHAVRILSSVDKEWTYTTDPENGVTVAGKWAYSTSPPDDIKNACIRLSAYYYKLKDSQVYDIEAIPDAGLITVPKGMPADVKMDLEPYVKRVTAVAMV